MNLANIAAMMTKKIITIQTGSRAKMHIIAVAPKRTIAVSKGLTRHPAVKAMPREARMDTPRNIPAFSTLMSRAEATPVFASSMTFAEARLADIISTKAPNRSKVAYILIRILSN